MSDEAILHFGMVKLRVVGFGSLKMTMKGLDANSTTELLALQIQPGPGRQLDRLCNFTNQRAQLRVYTTNINEHFRINRIVFYIKTLYSQYPQ